MAPKRKSDAAAESSAAKKPNNATGDQPDEPSLWRHPRWSEVSASGNSDAAFREAMTKPDQNPFEYLNVCKQLLEQIPEEVLRHRQREASDDEEGDQEPPCDGGRTCSCMKPLAEHPEAKFSLSRAGVWRFNMMREQLPYRNPETFGILMFSDFHTWGTIEVIENQVLDFNEAIDWREQWAVCEALVMFLGAEEINSMGWSEEPADFLALVENGFLTMLAKLESLDLLKPDSEVKNLAAIMSLAIGNAYELANYGLEFEGLDIKVLAYALKHDIVLPELLRTEKSVEKLSDKARAFNLPEYDANDNDPWQWTKTLKKYTPAGEGKKMGGDKYDVTSWTSAKRKKNSSDRKDPCSKEMMANIKKGMVLSLAN
ncbi:hypothetical protein N7481_007179 [Penicillium waksmanii]|uniref:uncharacterized protein n=1 Tax=Penicillium waksmanii TaxID=69791 RepID=UPI002547A9AB|nr:uncharacterized protein N7481_007179 [Penicillium waksmanii]KAJ5979881.1 hypothetical protein N7481_007179 [Penicillium waksmanii]